MVNPVSNQLKVPCISGKEKLLAPGSIILNLLYLPSIFDSLICFYASVFINMEFYVYTIVKIFISCCSMYAYYFKNMKKD